MSDLSLPVCKGQGSRERVDGAGRIHSFLYLEDVGDSLILQHFLFCSPSFFPSFRFCQEKKGGGVNKRKKVLRKGLKFAVFAAGSGGAGASHRSGSFPKTPPVSSKKPGIAGNAGAGSLLGFSGQGRGKGWGKHPQSD